MHNATFNYRVASLALLASVQASCGAAGNISALKIDSTSAPQSGSVAPSTVATTGAEQAPAPTPQPPAAPAPTTGSESLRATCDAAPPVTTNQITVPGAPAMPKISDTGPAAADMTSQVQGAILSLAAMSKAANRVQASSDPNCIALYAGDLTEAITVLSGQVSATAQDSILDGSSSDAYIVNNLANTSATIVSAARKITAMPAATLNATQAPSTTIAEQVGVARGTPMVATGKYYEIPWGNAVKAGINPSDTVDGGKFTASIPAPNADGTLPMAPQPAPPTGETAAWVNHVGTQPFGNGATPVVALTAHQGGLGNCSELSGFNTVASLFPQILIDHLKKVGVTADGTNDVYQATLFIDGTWQTVQFDASTPGDSMGATTTDMSQFWMPLYEKAIATVFTSYDASDFILVMQTLTGSEELYGYTDPDKALTDLQAGNAEEAMVTATGPTGWFNSQTGKATVSSDPQGFDLIADHAYAVLSHTSTTVTVLNPWNNTAAGVGLVTLPNSVFMALFNQFATLLPQGEVADTSGQVHYQTPP